MLLRSYHLFSVCLLSLLVSGCVRQNPNSADQTSNQSPIDAQSTAGSGSAADPVQFDFGSCQNQAGDGEAAGEVIAPSIQKAAFDKPFDFAKFKPLAKASLNESLRWIQAQGISLWKMPSIASLHCSQPLFAALNLAPAPLAAEFSAGVPLGAGIVLGLFVPPSSLLIRENTNRWTLVHEWMHQLFYQESPFDGDQGYREVQVALEKLTSSAANSSAGERIQNLLNFKKKYWAYILHFSLEEVAIEDFLKNQFASGQLGFVTLDDDGYLRQSAHSVEQVLYQIDDQAVALLDSKTATDAELADLNALEDELNDNLLTLRSLVEAHLAPPPVPLSNRASLNLEFSLADIVIRSSELPTACGHSARADQLSKQVTLVLRNLAG